MMDDYMGLVGMPVKQCKEEVMGSDMCMSGGIQVTSVMNNNNIKYGRCEGCGEHILDRFVMQLSGLSWHEDCLSCSQCNSSLDTSCYYREGKLFCRQDYERIFLVKCDRCGLGLSPHDLVMRTMGYTFHLACFHCAVCGQQLQRGDQYVLRAGQLICRMDLEKELYMMQSYDRMDQSAWLGDDHLGYEDLGGGRPRDGRRGPKRPRTILTAAQRRQFKASFEVSPKPCRKVREALGKESGLSVRVVQVWFQNQRAKMKKMQRRSKTDKDGKPLDKEGGKEKEGERVGGGGDGDSYCDSEASLDDGSCYDNLEDVASPHPDLGHSIDLRHHHQNITAKAPAPTAGDHHPLSSQDFLHHNPIDRLYLMQDSFFQP